MTDKRKYDDLPCECTWSCAKCNRQGAMSIWRHAEETPEQAVSRVVPGARSLCVDGCLFEARAKESEEICK